MVHTRCKLPQNRAHLSDWLQQRMGQEQGQQEGRGSVREHTVMGTMFSLSISVVLDSERTFGSSKARLDQTRHQGHQMRKDSSVRTFFALARPSTGARACCAELKVVEACVRVPGVPRPDGVSGCRGNTGLQHTSSSTRVALDDDNDNDFCLARVCLVHGCGATMPILASSAFAALALSADLPACAHAQHGTVVRHAHPTTPTTITRKGPLCFAQRHHARVCGGWVGGGTRLCWLHYIWIAPVHFDVAGGGGPLSTATWPGASSAWPWCIVMRAAHARITALHATCCCPSSNRTTRTTSSYCRTFCLPICSSCVPLHTASPHFANTVPQILRAVNRLLQYLRH